MIDGMDNDDGDNDTVLVTRLVFVSVEFVSVLVTGLDVADEEVLEDVLEFILVLDNVLFELLLLLDSIFVLPVELAEDVAETDTVFDSVPVNDDVDVNDSEEEDVGVLEAVKDGESVLVEKLVPVMVLVGELLTDVLGVTDEEADTLGVGEGVKEGVRVLVRVDVVELEKERLDVIEGVTERVDDGVGNLLLNPHLSPKYRSICCRSVSVGIPSYKSNSPISI